MITCILATYATTENCDAQRHLRAPGFSYKLRIYYARVSLDRRHWPLNESDIQRSKLSGVGATRPRVRVDSTPKIAADRFNEVCRVLQRRLRQSHLCTPMCQHSL